MMEFTTPPSYGSQTVNVANIYKNGQLVSGTTKGTVKHTKTVLDPVTGWEKPLALTANWNGKSLDGKVVVDGILEVADAKSIDLVDIMAEVPQIIKKFVAGAVGTRPFLYQVSFGWMRVDLVCADIITRLSTDSRPR